MLWYTRGVCIGFIWRKTWVSGSQISGTKIAVSSLNGTGWVWPPDDHDLPVRQDDGVRERPRIGHGRDLRDRHGAGDLDDVCRAVAFVSW